MKRRKEKLVKFLEVEEIKNFQTPLINKVKKALNEDNKNSITDKIAIRDFALISLVYSCALRISEACKLEIEDLDLNKKLIYILDSKGDDRIVPIPEPVIKILTEWLEIRPNRKNNPYVFINIKGSTRPGAERHVNQKYYNQLFNRLSIATGVKLKDGSNVHPHTLRHSRAMEIYDSGTQLEMLQAILGHKDIKTTQVYCKVRTEKLNEIQQTVTGGIIEI